MTGLGKSGLVGAKLAATFASTGTPAFFVHAADALHGDAGMVAPGDVLVAISKSGTTPEVERFARMVQAPRRPRDRDDRVRRDVRAVRARRRGHRLGVERECDPNDLAPTASTAVAAVVGDAIAIGLMVAKGFGPDDFHEHHPGGALGARLEGPRVSGTGVVVVGSFMMDLVVRAPRRPEPGETLVGSSFDVFLGGKGCNQAIAAARAGAATAMVGRLGADDFGARFLDRLAADGIDTTGVTVDPDEGTGVGAPLVEDGGENSIVIIPRANHRMSVADVEAASDVIGGAAVLLLQLELPLDVVEAAAKVAQAAATRVLLNPAPASDGAIDAFAGLVDVLVPNEVEAAVLSGIEDDPLRAAAALRDRIGGAVVVTVGDQGAWVIDDGAPQRLAAHPVQAVDTVGAGDAFCGALGARLAAGASLRDAAAYANAAAALSVTRPGAEPSMPRSADIEALLGDCPTSVRRNRRDATESPHRRRDLERFPGLFDGLV